MLTVKDVYDFINERAPFDTQLDFDNSGLLIGDPARQVSGIHVALDCTEEVVDEAIKHGANLIVTHHPVIFGARKHMREDQAEGRLLCRIIRANIAVISAHTNLDRAVGGVNDMLAALLGLTDIVGEDFLRVGHLPCPMTAEAFGKAVEDSLHTTVRVMAPAGKTVSVVGMCSGSGSEYWQDAASMGADAFVSGEIRHHHALAAYQSGVACFECGHHATEEPGIFALADALQKWQNVVQYDVCVSKSQAGAYGRML